jgi:formate C-acetyltransferase
MTSGLELVRGGRRLQDRVEDWFFVQELAMEHREALLADGREDRSALFNAELLNRVVADMPISLAEGAVIAGSQDCAFSPSYALINPAFRVETFAGYCDPTALYADLAPNEARGLTRQRIAKVKDYWDRSPYVRQLAEVYRKTGQETQEVVYFVEPVTGHTIPDLRPSLREGLAALRDRALALDTEYGRAMARALEAPVLLGRRYRALAAEKAAAAKGDERTRLERMVDVLSRVPEGPCHTLQEAVQSFALLWQVMVVEQSPNPYAFSVGNLDRILQPFLEHGPESREEAVALVRCLLAFFQVGNRCWAISQNVMVGGREAEGRDLTCDMTGIVLDAFFASNDPQPALSVKVHSGTPESLYRSLGRFFFTAGHSTPSLFNDDSLLPMLQAQGMAQEDLADYSIAGCQEPLIMGKSSLNTTNTWLNLAKVLELSLNDGKSLLTGRQLGPTWADLGIQGGQTQAYRQLAQVFYKTLDHFLPRMRDAGNACTTLLGREKPVPFTSSLHDGLTSGRDMRDPRDPGTRYSGSGCLIHGMAVTANSLYAVEKVLGLAGWTAADLRQALAADFEGHEVLRETLLNQDKFGNDLQAIDSLAADLVNRVSQKVRGLRNGADRPYLADWSTPTTHLLYGHWVGATPDGRRARQMLNYGLDPLVGTCRPDLPRRFLSAWKLPYSVMTGGYASHIGLSPSVVDEGLSLEDRGLWLAEHVIRPLFRLGQGVQSAPFYVYFNVDDVSHLRRVLADPKRYAPGGVYILRIHGTFVNFLDLSPAIQQDIMKRLEAGAPNEPARPDLVHA